LKRFQFVFDVAILGVAGFTIGCVLIVRIMGVWSEDRSKEDLILMNCWPMPFSTKKSSTSGILAQSVGQ
jgi:hypothetical protein